MNMETETTKPPHAHRNPLEYIAFWQFLTFLLLIALLWASQALDLSEVFFGHPAAANSWFGACITTAGIIIVGFITITHTYVQQKRVLRGFLRVCTYCKKVKLENKAWEQLEQYVSERTLAEFSHGICPECYKRVMEQLDHEVPPAAPPGAKVVTA